MSEWKEGIKVVRIIEMVNEDDEKEIILVSLSNYLPFIYSKDSSPILFNEEDQDRKHGAFCVFGTSDHAKIFFSHINPIYRTNSLKLYRCKYKESDHEIFYESKLYRKMIKLENKIIKDRDGNLVPNGNKPEGTIPADDVRLIDEIRMDDNE